MFSSESADILSTIHDHLAAWRATDSAAAQLPALRGAFETLSAAAARAGFDDVAQLSGNVESLLAQDDAVADDVALLNLLEEVHDGLAAELGFVPAQTREQVSAMNSLVAALLSDGVAGDAVLNVQTVTVDACVARVRADTDGDIMVTGGALQMDNRVMEKLEVILKSLIRNFAADGNENKNITVIANNYDGQLFVECGLDGARINKSDARAIAEQAASAGMTFNLDAIGEEHLLHILTRPAADDLREVRGAVRELGGLFAMQLRDDGVTFQLQLPRTVGRQRALLVTVGDYEFAFAAEAVERVLRVDESDVTVRDDGATVTVDGRSLPVINLSAALGAKSLPSPTRLLAVMRLAERRVAFQVDAFRDLIDATVQPAGAQLATVSGVVGIARCGESVALLMDPDAFVDRNALQRDGLTAFPLHRPRAQGTMRVLVLDTQPCPMVIPVAMVAEVVGAGEWGGGDGDCYSDSNSDAHGAEHGDGDRLLCGTYAWRGLTVPVINSAAAFGVDDQPAGKHLAILWALKGDGDGDRQNVFGIKADRPSIMEIADQPAPPPDELVRQPDNLLGYVRIGARTAIIPDLANIAQRISRAQ